MSKLVQTAFNLLKAINAVDDPSGHNNNSIYLKKMHVEREIDGVVDRKEIYRLWTDVRCENGLVCVRNYDIDADGLIYCYYWESVARDNRPVIVTTVKEAVESGYAYRA